MRVLAALLSVYIFWGGTFLAARFAIETIPPASMTALRNIIGGLLLYVFFFLKGRAQASWREWRDAAVTGTLLLVTANAGMVWAQQFVSSGMAATLIGMTPVWLVLLDWLWKKGTRPNAWVTMGLLSGFVGIVFLVRHLALSGDAQYLFGICVVLAASFSWALGSIYSRSASQPNAPLLGVAMQMISGGTILSLIALLSGQWAQTDLSAVSMKSWIALLYLILCGSFLGYASYIWLLAHAPISLVSTYAYVNPVVAVFVGWLLADEIFGVREAVAALLILLAVVLITTGNAKNKAEEKS